jgi:cytochrome P450 family 142 subfamily A polypeptide 1
MSAAISYTTATSWDHTIWDHLRELQENDPVYWSEPDKVWVITRYADVVAISKNQDLFTSGEGVRPGFPGKIGLIDEHEPRHGVLRRMINKGFTPRMVNMLERIFLAITTEAIDDVAGQGHCDFVHDIAVPLPLLLIAEMMGIHKKDRHRFHEWSDAMIAGDGNFDKPEIMAASAKAFIEYSHYLTDVIEERRHNPQDDLVSILVGAKDDGVLATFDNQDQMVNRTGVAQGELANDELIMLLTILLVAGNETTRNGLSGGMQMLIENPEERQYLIDDPSLIPGAVEEMIRIVSPVHSFSRTVTRDTILHGQRIKQGDLVLMIYPIANRDPRVFDEPDRFRIHRNPSHLGFGIGSHFCLGANLARMEMRVGFTELLRRLPDMEYSHGGPILKPSSLVRSCTEMKLNFTPEQEA